MMPAGKGRNDKRSHSANSASGQGEWQKKMTKKMKRDAKQAAESAAKQHEDGEEAAQEVKKRADAVHSNIISQLTFSFFSSLFLQIQIFNKLL